MQCYREKPEQTKHSLAAVNKLLLHNISTKSGPVQTESLKSILFTPGVHIIGRGMGWEVEEGTHHNYVFQFVVTWT
jgi:hypothetical protein